MKDIELLSIEMPEHVAHAREKYATLKLEQLIEERKRVATDKTTAANVARAAFEFGIELPEGKFKALNEKYPKYVKAVGYEIVETTVKKIVDNKIADVLVRKYKRAFDFGSTYKGVDVSELQVLQHLIEQEDEDVGLSSEELLSKYAIPERVAELKRAAYTNKVAELELNYRVCKVLDTLHKKNLEVLDVLIAERKREDTKAFMQKTAEWLNPAGRALFGL
jgi:hypothetical protein